MGLKELTERRKAIGDSLRGLVFKLSPWSQSAKDWTHDHCELCNAQIRERPLEGDFSEGYVTYTPSEAPSPGSFEGWNFIPAPLDRGRSLHWICPDCFCQFHEYFEWKLGA